MTPGRTRLRTLLEELRRRHVVQVALVYLAGGFGVLQGADIVFPVLGIPEWGFRLLVLLTLLLFPVALVLAWAYDLTPSGIVRVADEGEAGDPREEAHVTRAARRGLVLLSVVMLAGAGWLSFRWAVTGAEALPPLNPKALAVLPFEDLNRSDSTAFFASGIHEDIITHLSRIRDLTVISRTSVLNYAGAELPLREIARELGVGTILEGSVRRSGNRVRVVAQLIDARTDTHLWSETFDRELSDIFTLQTEIAERIALALEAELTADERARIERAPTENLEAYSAYLQGRVFSDRREDPDQAVQAVEAFRRAVELDPEFAVAWAALARARMWLFWSWPGYAGEATAASEALERARELAPEAAETRLAEGYLDFHGQGDQERALARFREVERLRPSDAEAITAVGMVLLRRGEWEAAAAAFTRALGLDPRSYNLSLALGQLHLRMRQPEEAARYLEQALALAPDLPGRHAHPLRLHLSGMGDTVQARGMMGRDGAGLDPEWRARLGSEVALYRGDVEGALALREGGASQDLEELALLRALAGDSEGAAEAAERLRAAARDVIDAAGGDGPVQTAVVARAHARIGVAEALLGNRVQAVREATTAVALVPVTEDAWTGAEHVVSLAVVYTLIGEQEAALDRIEELLRVPSPLTVHDLRLNPLWDPLRENPRMEELLG
jgi:TolB-like protein